MSVEDKLEEFLKSIKGVTCFRERLKIYAPTCYGKCVDAVEKLISNINKVIGGSTVYDAEGSWISDGRLYREPVKVIEAAHHCLSKDEAEAIAKAIVEYAKEARQEALAIYGSNFYIASVPELLKAYEKLVEKKPVI
ncbi:MAG: hypothetical protein QXT64_03750 [Desulfurococcaceae archaeon]